LNTLTRSPHARRQLLIDLHDIMALFMPKDRKHYGFLLLENDLWHSIFM
jgi:hypothetical protein